MPQVVRNIGHRLSELTFNQRVLLGGVAVAGVISLFVFSVWLQNDEKAVLFTNLSPEDASVAIQELAKQDVVADLVNGGTTILVPAEQVHRLRVDLAGRGIPSSGTVGFEIFDGKQYGLTEFLQNVNFKRALEGELTKSIETLQGIRAARVHLVLPKPSIFKKLAAEPTASVVLRLGRSARLAGEQIVGIQSLVAASVEGLSVANVTVVDQHSKVLSTSVQDDDIGRTEGQLTLKKEVESYLSEKAQSMLAGVLGPGRSLVRVDATLNFEQIDSEREIFDPDATVVRSEERDESSDPETGGSEESILTNYEINRTVERIVGQTGGVEQLSVAVFVDGTYAEGDDGTAIYTPLPAEQLDQLQRIVQTAIGINARRGDQIEVVNMQFTNQTADTALPQPFGTTWLELVTQNGGRLLLVIVLVALAVSLRRNIAQLIGAAGPAAGGRRIFGRGTPNAAAARFDGLPDLSNKMIEDVQEYATENPERIAEFVQSWIYEEDQRRDNARPARGATSSG